MIEFPKLPIEDCPGIYIIINKINGKKYIGSSFRVLRRIWVHFRGVRGHYLKNAILKYGRENFEAYMLEKVDRKNLPIIEGKWIRKLKPEYNITKITNSGGQIFSKETIERMRISATGKKRTEQEKEAIRIFHTGRKRPPETGRKISLKKLGIPRDAATKKKLSLSHKGKILSESHKAAIAAGHARRKLLQLGDQD